VKDINYKALWRDSLKPLKNEKGDTIVSPSSILNPNLSEDLQRLQKIIANCSSHC